MKSIHVYAHTSELDKVCDFVDTNLEKEGASEALRMKIRLAVEEIFINIASYSYPAGAENKGADVCVDVNDGILTLIFQDQGIQYDPTAKPDPDVTLDPEDRKIGGLGVFLVKKIMDQVDYEYRESDKSNILTVTKQLD